MENFIKIPKIIHYCWFGPNQLPKKEQSCMASWSKFFPDYEIKKWNESTFPLDKHPFAKQAYDIGKYAFVSDYVRAYVVYEQGGLYFDTDLEVKKDFSEFLKYSEGVLGFETSKYVGTAMMAFIPKHPIMNSFLNYYKNKNFVNERGQIEITANPAILKDILIDYGFVFNGEEQMVNNIFIYPRSHFFPKKISDGNFRITDETYTIHHFEGSWLTERQKKRGQNIIWRKIFRPVLRACMRIIKILLGDEKLKKIEMIVRNKLK